MARLALFALWPPVAQPAPHAAALLRAGDEERFGGDEMKKNIHPAPSPEPLTRTDALGNVYVSLSRWREYKEREQVRVVSVAWPEDARQPEVLIVSKHDEQVKQ